jgi:hypothetical protein
MKYKLEILEGVANVAAAAVAPLATLVWFIALN